MEFCSFTKTNQSDVLDTPDLPALVDDIRHICGLESALLGGAASANGELPSTTSSPTPTPTGATQASHPMLALSLIMTGLFGFLLIM